MATQISNDSAAISQPHEWRSMDSAPTDGTVIEGINRQMEMPVDMRFGTYRLIIGDVVDRSETGWHVPHLMNGRTPTIYPSHWRPKTSGDKLTLQRFEPLVEWPPVPSRDGV